MWKLLHAGGVRCLFSVNSVILLLVLLKLIQFTQKHKQPRKKTIFHLFSWMFCVFYFPKAISRHVAMKWSWRSFDWRAPLYVWHFHAVYPSVSSSASIHRNFTWKCTVTHSHIPTIHRAYMPKRQIQYENNTHKINISVFLLFSIAACKRKRIIRCIE